MSDIRSFPTAKERNIRLARYYGLKETLSEEVRKVRDLRRKSMCLFSARHLNFFLQGMIKYAVKDEMAPNLLDLAFDNQD